MQDMLQKEPENRPNASDLYTLHLIDLLGREEEEEEELAEEPTDITKTKSALAGAGARRLGLARARAGARASTRAGSLGLGRDIGVDTRVMLRFTTIDYYHVFECVQVISVPFGLPVIPPKTSRHPHHQTTHRPCE